MGDVFFEQIIKKKPTIKERLIKAGILIVSILLSLIFFRFALIPNSGIGSILFLVAVGLLFFAWYLITGLNLEYEYIYTNGEIDIDKISAKRKRKRLLTVRIDSFEEFEKYDVKNFKDKTFDMTFHACSHLLDDNVYYAIFKSKQGKKCLLTISPNQKLIDEINTQLKRRRR